MRPTCNRPCGGCELVVDEVDINIHAIACCSSAHNGADAHCGTTAASDDATEVAFTNANFQQHFVAVVLPSTTTASGLSTMERTTWSSTAVAIGAGMRFAESVTGRRKSYLDFLVAMNSAHTPEISNNFLTRSLGNAPCCNHFMAFALSTVRADGSDCGW